MSEISLFPLNSWLKVLYIVRIVGINICNNCVVE